MAREPHMNRLEVRAVRLRGTDKSMGTIYDDTLAAIGCCFYGYNDGGEEPAGGGAFRDVETWVSNLPRPPSFPSTAA